MTHPETALEPIDPDELLREVERYLAAVDLFRREGCEPRWANFPEAIV